MFTREWRDQVERDLFVSNRSRFVSGRLFAFIAAIGVTAAILYEIVR